LKSFGIPPLEITTLLLKFVAAVKSGEIFAPESHELYNLDRFSDFLRSGSKLEIVDRIMTSILYTWASEPTTQGLLETLVDPSTIFRIRSLRQAADLSYPADWYPKARRIRRKIIMHVGPTNSGKTHNALRALASAQVGVYAGPLRLLAHEVYERLNKGQIAPLHLGDEPTAPNDPSVSRNSDLETPNTDTADGNPLYVRQCNLRTGEENRFDKKAGLLSATVEMVPISERCDVAVIDEIQMISEPDRGGAWTNAVLGVCAKEVHLCGEETAIPVIQELLKDTGDELTIKRYQRLSPLIVENEGLGGDLSRVRKGDCVVTFSRTNIFKLKRKIEEVTGLRCAVAYGRLPPEIRSEQAALFNNPGSGYDVMIGSDAIGMGLNL
jgi:ATP-dependent RNA helicase SUPV3L1/SUV3